MKIIIPMAGKGARFAEAGYKEPKPFIKMPNGSTMIETVLTNMLHETEGVSVTLIYQQKDDPNQEILHNVVENVEKHFDGCVEFDLIPINRYTGGAAETAMIAFDPKEGGSMSLDDLYKPLIITDCDHFLGGHANIFADAIDYFVTKDCDGGIITHIDDNPKWSFSKISGGRIVDVVEKRVISPFANTGDYYFKNATEFFRVSQEAIDRNEKQNGEFYVAPLFTSLIRDGKTVLPYVCNEMVGLGTPDDLNKFKNNLDTIRMIF